MASQFKQPIVLLSSSDGKRQATLVALGNYKNKLTWVSTDGISVSFEDGVLIATRGYSQDLMESNHESLNNLLNLSSKARDALVKIIIRHFSDLLKSERNKIKLKFPAHNNLLFWQV